MVVEEWALRAQEARAWQSVLAITAEPPAAESERRRGGRGAPGRGPTFIASVKPPTLPMSSRAYSRSPRSRYGRNCHFCPGREPPFWAFKRPARPYKSAIQN